MRIYDNGVYRNATPEEELQFNQPIPKELQIEALKQRLADTDYLAIKYAEGQLSEDEYAPMKAQRQSWRDEINRLEQ